MKRLLEFLIVVAIPMAALLCPSLSQATPDNGQSELVQVALQNLRVLTLSDDLPAGQRLLIAVNLAASRLGVTDAGEIMDAYWVASVQVDDRLKRTINYTWNGSAWEESARTTRTYDGTGLLTEKLSEDRVAGAWMNSSREVYTYDGSGLLLTTIEQIWEIDHWNNVSRSTYSFDGSGRLIEEIDEDWQNEDWVKTNRLTQTYTGNLLETQESQVWQNDAWVNESRTTFGYNGSNRLTQLLSESWENEAWTPSSRTTYTFDGNAYVVETLSESWDGDAADWVNSLKNEYVNDGSGNRLVNNFSIWTTDPDKWTLFGIDSSSYEGNKIVENVHTTTFLTPTPSSRTLYTYDGDNLIERINQGWSPARLAASTWVNSTRTVYEYEAGGTAVQVSDEPAPVGWELNQNYPNPFNPSTSIRYSLQHTSQVDVTVYNMLGQVVKTLENGVQAPGVYETTWDGTDAGGRAVASGLYLYRIATDRFTETRKMMLLK